jgi:hypothetical protein
MDPLTEHEQDISFAIGFLEGWTDAEPSQVKENLKIIIDGIALYRQKYIVFQEDYEKLRDNYNHLAALSSSYLALIAQQKEQIDSLLINDQREFHRTEPESEFGAF